MNVLASVLLVQRLGRKALHATTEAFAVVGLVALGGYFYILEADPERAASLGWMPITFFVWFIISVSLGVVPLVCLIHNSLFFLLDQKSYYDFN